jgi:hypothetical protein
MKHEAHRSKNKHENNPGHAGTSETQADVIGCEDTKKELHGAIIELKKEKKID